MTASDIKNFASDLQIFESFHISKKIQNNETQIFESFHISKKIPNNETYSSTANIF